MNCGRLPTTETTFTAASRDDRSPNTGDTSSTPPSRGGHGPHSRPRQDWSQTPLPPPPPPGGGAGPRPRRRQNGNHPPPPPPPLVRDSAVTRVTAAATGNSHGCAVLLQRALSPLRGVLQVGARSGTET